MSEPITLWEGKPAVKGGPNHFSQVGTFEERQWCATHADFVMKHLDVRMCRWAIMLYDEEPKKPCQLVSRLVQKVSTHSNYNIGEPCFCDQEGDS